jgi:hypothetical protein
MQEKSHTFGFVLLPDVWIMGGELLFLERRKCGDGIWRFWSVLVPVYYCCPLELLAGQQAVGVAKTRQRRRSATFKQLTHLGEDCGIFTLHRTFK